MGDREGGDWKPRCICRRMQSFGMGVVGGKRELTCSHQLPHRQSLELELREGGGGKGGGGKEEAGGEEGGREDCREEQRAWQRQ